MRNLGLAAATESGIPSSTAVSCNYDECPPSSSVPMYIPNAGGFGKDYNRMFGISPSDIDKYSRVVFPVCFVCFNLMYWIIYLHISHSLVDDSKDSIKPS